MCCGLGARQFPVQTSHCVLVLRTVAANHNGTNRPTTFIKTHSIILRYIRYSTEITSLQELVVVFFIF